MDRESGFEMIDATTLERTIPFGPYECNVTAVDADIIEEDWMRSKFFARTHLNKRQAAFRKEFGKVVHPENFPQNMSPAALYPTTSSKFTAIDGTSHDVTCSSRTSTTSAAKATCPVPFQPSFIPNSARPCMLPCPTHAFSATEYENFRLSIVIPGSIGLLTNTFMLL
jgi:hypothetical protein